MPSNLLRVPTLFLCCLFIRLFCHVPFIPLFFTKILLFNCHLLVGLSSSISTPYLLVIFFLFVCYVLFCIAIFFIFLLSPLHSGLFVRVISFVRIFYCFSLFVSTCSSGISQSYHFACGHRFLNYVSSRISHSGFVFLFGFFRGNQFFFLGLISLQHWLVSLIVLVFVEICVNNFLRVFSDQRKLIIFHWVLFFFTPSLSGCFHMNPSDSKSVQFSMNILSIQADLMLLSGWSRFFHWFPILAIPFTNVWGLFQVH